MALSGFSNISKDITNTFAKIKQIFEDPKSYEHEINDESNKNDTYNEHVQKAFVEILSKFKQIDDKCIEFVKENLKLMLLPSDMKLDYSNLGDYLLSLQQRGETTNCKYYLDNYDIGDSLRDDDIIPVEILFKGMECKSCRFFKDAHTICNKYSAESYKLFESNACLTCGFDGYSHNVCDSYDNHNENECNNCGRDLFAHQQKEKNSGKTHCRHFEKSDGFMDCNNCIHNKIDHMLNPQLFKMNKKAYNEFTNLAFEIQGDFLSCFAVNCEQKYLDMFYSVMKMNYSEAHPSYNMFCNALIPQIPMNKYKVKISSV